MFKNLLAKVKAIPAKTWWKIGGIALVVIGTGILAFFEVPAASITSIVVAVCTLVGLILALVLK